MDSAYLQLFIYGIFQVFQFIFSILILKLSFNFRQLIGPLIGIFFMWIFCLMRYYFMANILLFLSILLGIIVNVYEFNKLKKQKAKKENDNDDDSDDSSD